jgi:serine/threonine protein phosphatase PrpC
MKFSGFSLAKGKELKGDDAYLVKKYDDFVVGIVCDGVGSALEGREAAKRVVNYLDNAFLNMPKSWEIEKSIKHFITSINKILYNEGMQNYERPEYLSTLALALIKGNRLYSANVGDSRIYLFRDNLYQLSLDHNDKENSSVITEAIGMREDVGIYYFENNLQINDKILLCSDGLYEVLDEDELIRGLKVGASFLVKMASKKVDDNLPDDTTAVVIEVDETPQKEELKKINLPIADDLKENMEIDGFRLIKSLIQNNRTWLAEKKGKKYVLKFAPLEAKDDENILDLYVKEAINAIRLRAGFFPRAVIPKNRSYRYYVMEYIEGEVPKKLSVDEAIKLGKTLLRASQYFLKYDLVHGDIKPENIIKSKRGVFKIVDFGSVVEVFSTTSKAGTPSYLAPERFDGAPINESTEIFAIGVTLYELLTKRLPYGEIEPFSTPKFKAPIPPKKLNANIPEWLNSIILKAIEIDKDKRYQHYSEMLYDLSHPEKVKPYMKKEYLLEKETNYKFWFIVSLMINFILIGVLLYKT